MNDHLDAARFALRDAEQRYLDQLRPAALAIIGDHLETVFGRRPTLLDLDLNHDFETIEIDKVTFDDGTSIDTPTLHDRPDWRDVCEELGEDDLVATLIVDYPGQCLYDVPVPPADPGRTSRHTTHPDPDGTYAAVLADVIAKATHINAATITIETVVDPGEDGTGAGDLTVTTITTAGGQTITTAALDNPDSRPIGAGRWGDHLPFDADTRPATEAFLANVAAGSRTYTLTVRDPGPDTLLLDGIAVLRGRFARSLTAIRDALDHPDTPTGEIAALFTQAITRGGEVVADGGGAGGLLQALVELGRWSEFVSATDTVLDDTSRVALNGIVDVADATWFDRTAAEPAGTETCSECGADVTFASGHISDVHQPGCGRHPDTMSEENVAATCMHCAVAFDNSDDADSVSDAHSHACPLHPYNADDDADATADATGTVTVGRHNTPLAEVADLVCTIRQTVDTLTATADPTVAVTTIRDAAIRLQEIDPSNSGWQIADTAAAWLTDRGSVEPLAGTLGGHLDSLQWCSRCGEPLHDDGRGDGLWLGDQYGGYLCHDDTITDAQLDAPDFDEWTDADGNDRPHHEPISCPPAPGSGPRIGIVKMSDIAGHPTMRMDAGYWLADEPTKQQMDAIARIDDPVARPIAETLIQRGDRTPHAVATFFVDYADDVRRHLDSLVAVLAAAVGKVDPIDLGDADEFTRDLAVAVAERTSTDDTAVAGVIEAMYDREVGPIIDAIEARYEIEQLPGWTRDWTLDHPREPFPRREAIAAVKWAFGVDNRIASRVVDGDLTQLIARIDDHWAETWVRTVVDGAVGQADQRNVQRILSLRAQHVAPLSDTVDGVPRVQMEIGDATLAFVDFDPVTAEDGLSRLIYRGRVYEPAVGDGDVRPLKAAKAVASVIEQILAESV